MIFVIRPWLTLALTLSSILAVYFQSINHPFSLFDDPGIVDHYGINSTLSFFDVIAPGGRFYYRPLVDLSYWLDFQMWGMDSSFMHLENIAVHLMNVYLVFLIASLLPVTSELKSLPIISALLFGLHPINSESVNWIAGRTDVFAGVFILLAVYSLIRAVQEQSVRFAMVAFAVAFIGILAKETAIMFMPVALLVTTCWPVGPYEISAHRSWRRRFILTPILVSFCLAISILILVYVKGHGNNAISLVFEGSTHVFIRSFEAFGFYVKKLFLPFPLNFAIVEISPLYAIAGIVMLCLLIGTLRGSGVPGIFLAASVLFMIPALIISATAFAWTPFGERYLYIPSAFAVIGCLELFCRVLVRWNAVKLFMPIVSILVVTASIATFQRGIIWGNNLALIEDTIAKSPNFGVMRNQYGCLLKQEGRFGEAEKQFNIALQKDNKKDINGIIRRNLVWMEIHDKPLDEARKILLSKIGDKAHGDVELLKRLKIIDESILEKTVCSEDRDGLVTEIMEINEVLYSRVGEPHYLYRSAQLALSAGNRHKAGQLFRRAYEDPRLKDYYREPARKLAEKMEAK